MKKVLTINIPFTVPWALPYGPAVVNGVLKHAGYNATIWDMSIDFRHAFKHNTEFKNFVQATTIGDMRSSKYQEILQRKCCRGCNTVLDNRSKLLIQT